MTALKTRHKVFFNIICTDISLQKKSSNRSGLRPFTRSAGGDVMAALPEKLQTLLGPVQIPLTIDRSGRDSSSEGCYNWISCPPGSSIRVGAATTTITTSSIRCRVWKTCTFAENNKLKAWMKLLKRSSHVSPAHVKYSPPRDCQRSASLMERRKQK